MEKVVLTEEQKDILEPIVEEIRSAKLGFEVAITHQYQATEKLWSHVKEMFPEQKFTHLKTPRDSDWFVTS